MASSHAQQYWAIMFSEWMGVDSLTGRTDWSNGQQQQPRTALVIIGPSWVQNGWGLVCLVSRARLATTEKEVFSSVLRTSCTSPTNCARARVRTLTPTYACM
eukprot:TRINITY_DN197728_c0_g1_i1.p1 TRINITY_DN197728_c0_g1~~TRINITY_DN197728_c0_g1_i1.p1  ORF type:complete len:102 (+),score=9.07 TRINITY_DN197728_c0_g1_i1:193-498(+)